MLCSFKGVIGYVGLMVLVGEASHSTWCAGEPTPLLQALRGQCENMIMHWIAPDDVVWTSDNIADAAEPIFAAVNLLRLLILREGVSNLGFSAMTTTVVGCSLGILV
jgi:hypothetical protein